VAETFTVLADEFTRIEMSKPARFWAIDFHVHTPASADARPEV